MKSRVIKAVVFDFYGVIYSNFNWEVIDRRIYSDPKLSQDFKEVITRANLGELTNEEVMEVVAKLADDDNHPDETVIEPYPTINMVAIGIIDRLKMNYQTGLLSNGSREQLEYVFNKFGGLNKFFDVVTTSSDMNHMKPNPEAFSFIVSKLGLKPNEVLMIDDSYRHIEGAKQAGLETFLFKDINGLRIKLDELGVIHA